MNKNRLSAALLCVCIICIVLSVSLCIDTGIALNKIKTSEVDASNDSLPLSSVLEGLIASLSVWGGFLIFEFMIASAGFFSSLLNLKLASSPAVKKFSYVSLGVFSVLLLFVIGTAVYIAVTLF